MKQLILPLTYEDINNQFKSSERDAKMMEFVSPLTTTEEELVIISKSITTAGKLAFVLGNPGIGKSTFLHTLTWRTHLQIRTIHDIDANEFIQDDLDLLFTEISRIGKIESAKNDAGISAIVINYLEYIDEFPEESIKSFFRKLNGLLRNTPVLILWPVVNDSDVQKMIGFSEHVSGTLYQRDRKIVRITGPKTEDYVDIAKRTIKVLNDGAELSDLGLTHDDLVSTFTEFMKLPSIEHNIRGYYERILSQWELNNNYIDTLRRDIPKPTEVWFIFPFKDAESVVNQFSRKGNRVEDAWTAVSDKFSDYIDANKQRAGKWNPKRLNLALHGAIKTRVMYLPTNLVISTALTYTDNQPLKDLINKHNPSDHWKKQAATNKSLMLSPIYRQLIGEQYPSGKRKGGPVVEALNKAEPIYKDVVKWISGTGGSDTSLNKAIAKALIECGIENVVVEKEHPFIKSIYPDIQIDLGHKIVCLEFHYTNQDEPHVIADYCLKKLDIYMSQLMVNI